MWNFNKVSSMGRGSRIAKYVIYPHVFFLASYQVVGYFLSICPNCAMGDV